MSLARLRALIIVCVLVVCAAVLVTVAIIKDNQAGSTTTESCAPGDVPVNIALPAKNEDIKVNVYNATDLSGISSQVAYDFRSRQVTVVAEAKEPTGAKIKGTAELRYGPQTVGVAWLVNTYFLNKGKLVFDINRTDDIVDVVIGPDFLKLASTTESKQALAAAGNPELPAGTCDATSR